MSLTPELRSRIESLLQANRVVLFMKGQPRMPQCGFSAKAVGALDGLGIEYAHVDVLADGEIREGIKRYGDWPTIPQLYVGGELVGGSDIILQMADSGELHTLLGLPQPDRTPPRITVTPAAAEMLRNAAADAGPDTAVALSIDAQFRPNFQLAPFDARAIAAESNGLRVQFDLASARRAEGITIDWVDDIRGKGLAVDNPNAPQPVPELTPAEVDRRVREGGVILVDVRPPEERAIASVSVPFRTFDEGEDAIAALPKDTPLAFMCHGGGRSGRAAARFRAQGFTEAYNVAGGIVAWAEDVDDSIPRY